MGRWIRLAEVRRVALARINGDGGGVMRGIRGIKVGGSGEGEGIMKGSEGVVNKKKMRMRGEEDEDEHKGYCTGGHGNDAEEEAWDDTTTTNTTNTSPPPPLHKPQHTPQSVRQNADSVKRSMNTKN